MDKDGGDDDDSGKCSNEELDEVAKILAEVTLEEELASVGQPSSPMPYQTCVAGQTKLVRPVTHARVTP